MNTKCHHCEVMHCLGHNDLNKHMLALEHSDQCPTGNSGLSKGKNPTKESHWCESTILGHTISQLVDAK